MSYNRCVTQNGKRLSFGGVKRIFIGIVFLNLTCVIGFDLSMEHISPQQLSVWYNRLTPDPIPDYRPQETDVRTVNLENGSRQANPKGSDIHPGRRLP